MGRPDYDRRGRDAVDRRDRNFTSNRGRYERDRFAQRDMGLQRDRRQRSSSRDANRRQENQETAPIAVTVVQVVMALAPPVMRIGRRKIMNRLPQAQMSLKMKAK